MAAETQVARAEGLPDGDLAIAQEVTEIKTSPTFMELLKTTTDIKRQAKDIKIRSDEDEKLAIDSISLIKKTLKALDDMRKEKVDLATRFTSMVNKLFREPKDDLEKARRTIEPRIDNYRREKRIAAEKERRGL